MNLRIVMLVCLFMAATISSAEPSEGRALTFDERVRAQTEIERVYYSYRVGATRPFEIAFPESAIQDKVRRTLRLSDALARRWNAPITREALEAEARRIERGTLFPERIRDLKASLGNDRLLYLEVFCRSILAERWAESQFLSDARIHGPLRARVAALRSQLIAHPVERLKAFPERTVTTVNPSQFDPAEPFPWPERIITGEFLDRGDPASPARLDGDAPAPDVTPIHETSDFLMFATILDRSGTSWTVATYSFPRIRWDEWWETVESGFDESVAAAAGSLGPSGTAGRDNGWPTSTPSRAANSANAPDGCVQDDHWLEGPLNGAPPAARARHTAVWTGNEMIVWGGYGNSSFLGTGARYDPTADYWRFLSAKNAPSPRYFHSAVWTGSAMVIWGGYGSEGFLGDGAIYDPAADTWTPLPIAGAPTPRYLHTATWVGDSMVVWGGADDAGYRADGARFDLNAGSWTPTSSAGAPTARELHTAVWTGNEILVWGGYGDQGFRSDGARYDPLLDSWAPIVDGALEARYGHSAVWTGTRMIIWGGFGPSGYLSSGAMFEPTAPTWTPTSNAGAPTRRSKHAAVWTGSRMLIWGGQSDAPQSQLLDGIGFDPVQNAWFGGTTTSTPKFEHTAVWTGSELVAWGGIGTQSLPTQSGERFDPSSGALRQVSAQALQARHEHSAIWTGTHMIVWGGAYGYSPYTSPLPLGTGLRYDPLADTWSSIASLGAPEARFAHTATWTGDVMVVWGGQISQNSTITTQTGGRYNPETDSWVATSVINAPSAVKYHSAVWTGRFVIVWGGTVASNAGYNTGGRYDPVADSWLQVNYAQAPNGRFRHGAIWTGTEMVVWGGLTCHEDNYSCYLGTGGRYNPSTNTWTPTATAEAPASRAFHAMIWDGARVVVWGGTATRYDYYYGRWISETTSSGGYYDPAADSWSPTPQSGSMPALPRPSAVWTGSRMVAWSGASHTSSGVRLEPRTNAWISTSQLDVPTGRRNHTAIWTGKYMIVWGGDESNVFSLNTGGRYGVDESSDADGDGARVCGGDCDDNASSVFPGAPQICDGVNNDCSSAGWPSLVGTNEGDDDGDGYSLCAGDCSLGDDTVFPGAPQICDQQNNDCLDPNWPALSETTEVDDDLDGLTECAGDCDDTRNDVYPQAPQLCDGVNNDCADATWPTPPADESDADNDGIRICAGDCDDSSPSIFPNAPQVCDGLNNDCADPSWPAVPAPELDGDSDLFRVCAGDCDDASADTYPGAPQYCDGRNTDCSDPNWPNLPADELDADGDGVRVCQGDCDDSDPLVWFTPGEVRLVQFTRDPETGASVVSWTLPSVPGGAFLVYDTIRSSTPSNFATGTHCVEANDGLDSHATDGDVPLEAAGFYYLVRAENSCPQGSGTLGRNSSGDVRSAASCP